MSFDQDVFTLVLVLWIVNTCWMGFICWEWLKRRRRRYSPYLLLSIVGNFFQSTFFIIVLYLSIWEFEVSKIITCRAFSTFYLLLATNINLWMMLLVLEVHCNIFNNEIWHSIFRKRKKVILTLFIMLLQTTVAIAPIPFQTQCFVPYLPSFHVTYVYDSVYFILTSLFPSVVIIITVGKIIARCYGRNHKWSNDRDIFHAKKMDKVYFCVLVTFHVCCHQSWMIYKLSLEFKSMDASKTVEVVLFILETFSILWSSIAYRCVTTASRIIKKKWCEEEHMFNNTGIVLRNHHIIQSNSSRNTTDVPTSKLPISKQYINSNEAS